MSGQRWVTLASNLGLEAASGSSYAFAVYSDQLKNTTGFSQNEIQTVASTGNIGLYFALVAGIVFDNVGPVTTLAIGVVLSTSGYLAMWAGARGYIPGDVAAMSAYAFVWSNGSSWFDTVAIAANIRNFPNDRGRITGLLKSLYGLTASLITVVFGSFFKSESPDEAIDVLLFLAVVSAVVGVIGMPTTRLVSAADAVPISPHEMFYVTAAMLCLGLLGLYVLIVAILEDKDVTEERDVWPTAVMVPILALQAVVILPAWFGDGESGESVDGQYVIVGAGADASAADSGDDSIADGEATPLLGGVKNGGVGGGDGSSAEPAVAEGATLIEMMRDPNFWLLSAVTMFGTGAGLAVINNIAQQVKAARGRGSTGGATLYIVLISVANCAGRLVWGYLSDRFQSINRAGWLTVVSASTASGMFVAAFADINALVVACLWVGFSYGGFWAVMPGILAELYGTRWFAVAYSVVSLFPALGSFLFSVTLTGRLYDENTDVGESSCYGQKCFRDAYVIIAFLGVFGTAIGLVLTYRTRHARRDVDSAT